MTQRLHSTDDVPFRCPHCRGPLASLASALHCAPCSADFPDRGGIRDFRCRRYDYYFNPVPRAEMAELVRSAPDTSWDGTVERFLRFVPNAAGWLDNLAVNGRYAWKLMLELRPGSRFLDLGCGLGNLTQNIAPHVGEVVALDLTWERLQFAQQRFAKFNPDDRITLVAGGDGKHLPFPDAHFDCIALSGVLEWIADDADLYAREKTPAARAARMLTSFFGGTNPRAMQLRFLAELRRILKPDGQLFVAIENRWSHQYFKGRPDHHTRLKYGSLLPRFVANLYSMARRRRPYRTYTHSFPGLRRLLTAAGFTHHECYGLTPGYSRLAEVIPAFTAQAFWKPRRRQARSERLERSAYFVPAFGMVATGAATPPVPLLGRLLAHIGQASPELGAIELHDCVVTGRETIVLRGSAGSTGIVLKIPVSEAAHSREACNLRMLESLAAHATIGRFVARPVANGVHQALCYYVERGIVGLPLGGDELALSRSAAAAKVTTLLTAMHGADTPRVSLRQGESGSLYEGLVIEPFAKLRAAGVDSQLGDGLESRLRSVLGTGEWAVAPCHGELTSEHLLVDAGEVSVVMDWGSGRAQGLPALDAISYVEAMERRSNPRASVSDNLLRLARWEWSSSAELEFLRGIYRHFRIDAGAHEALCYLYWIQYMARQLETTARFDAEYIRRNVRPMLAMPATV